MANPLVGAGLQSTQESEGTQNSGSRQDSGSTQDSGEHVGQWKHVGQWEHTGEWEQTGQWSTQDSGSIRLGTSVKAFPIGLTQSGRSTLTVEGSVPWASECMWIEWRHGEAQAYTVSASSLLRHELLPCGLSCSPVLSPARRMDWVIQTACFCP